MQSDNFDPAEAVPSEDTPADDDSWIQVQFFFVRCCGSSLKLPILPSLLVEGISEGSIELLGWDERNGLLFANAWAQPCSSCLRMLRGALDRAFTGIEDYEYENDEEGEGGKWFSE